MLRQYAVLQKGIHEIWYINENMRRIMVRPVNLAAIHIVTLYIKDSGQVMAHCITSFHPYIRFEELLKTFRCCAPKRNSENFTR